MLVGFMKVFNNINKLEHKESFEGWIWRIMISECFTNISLQKKRLFIDDENYFDETINPIESQFSVDDIQFFIDQLPQGCKMVFNLYIIERGDK
jgi:RNA polymerase sigma-70 factor (ECF subfamily)